jgi:hypothetical protein
MAALFTNAMTARQVVQDIVPQVDRIIRASAK